MSQELIGQLAAIGTSICFSIGPAFFTLAGKKVGSVIVNRTRLVFAVILLSLTHFFIFQTLLPINTSSEQWLWFSLSGIVGLALGDAALFQAFLMIGTRLTMLIFALSPLISAILGWAFFQETFTSMQFIGMGLTIGGVVWVIGEKNTGETRNTDRKQYLIGLLFAVLAAMGQAFGLFFAKKGFIGDFPALSGVLIRMIAALVVIWLWTFMKREASTTLRTLKENIDALRLIMIASVVGPFLGVWLSLLSVANIPLGIATTLQALPPIFLIPIAYFIFKEKVSYRSIGGTIIALSGVALLFLF